MIPDDPLIHFTKREDFRIAYAEIKGYRIAARPVGALVTDRDTRNAPELFNANATELRRAKLKRLLKRLREVKPPPDWRPLGYEW